MSTREPKPPTVLVVDDTPTNVGVLLEMLGREGCRVLVARDGDSALEQAQYATPDLILLDVMMPGIDGFETCRRLKRNARTSDVPVIFMTALGDLEDKVKGFDAGGCDYVVKPFDHEEVLARVRTHLRLEALRNELADANRRLESRVEERTAELKSALAEVESLRQKLQQENRYLRQEIGEATHTREIVGSSTALRDVLLKIEMVACTGTTVLVHGETGTGKELIAREIHERSPRRDKALVKLNCAAISAGLVESELFGHMKGAFTGAADRRIGRFELADGGTLFLDEVSELPLETQTKLLRVLQEGEFEPVGSSKPIKVDVRIVAATNRDLTQDVAAGRFRSDLYYRLNVFPLEIPPLRLRRDDIPALAEHFMARAARRIGKPLTHVAPDTLAKLVAYDWPGNIRDLQNTIERAAILSAGKELRVDWELGPAPRNCLTLAGASTGSPAMAVVSTAGWSTGTASAASTTAGSAPATASLDESLSLHDIERSHFISVLRRTHGVVEGPNGAAKLLNLKPSTTRFRMKKLGIRKEHYL
jgi:DNA-binding NtrC family response regulator